jgi:hypothetical protein
VVATRRRSGLRGERVAATRFQVREDTGLGTSPQLDETKPINLIRIIEYAIAGIWTGMMIKVLHLR